MLKKNNIYVKHYFVQIFTITFHQFNAALLNTIINIFFFFYFKLLNGSVSQFPQWY